MQHFIVTSAYAVRDAEHVENLIKDGLCKEYDIDRETLYWRMYETYLAVAECKDGYRIVPFEGKWIAIAFGDLHFITGEGDTPEEALADQKLEVEKWKEKHG